MYRLYAPYMSYSLDKLDSKQIEIFKTLCSKAKVTQSQMLDYAIKNILIPQLEKETGLNV